MPNSSLRQFPLHLQPLQRIAISALPGVVLYFLLPQSLGDLVRIMISWITFSAVFLVLDWIILFRRPIEEIKTIARRDDGSKAFVFTMVVLTSFASLFAVLLLLTSGQPLSWLAPLVVMGMLLSWLTLHTLFIFHYAHLYYGDDEKGAAGGLDFPGKDLPDYIDFAYFSLVIGCTFQVSDVVITSKHIRRRVLLHGFLSFLLNTFVVALTINLVAGVSGR